MIRQINEEKGKIDAWVNANKLSLNIDKTNFMMFIIKNIRLCENVDFELSSRNFCLVLLCCCVPVQLPRPRKGTEPIY